MSGALTAVVTGAGSGIGLATAQRLRADGWQVLGLDLAGAEPEVVRADVTDLASLPLGREAEPAEIVEVILSLVNPASSYLNGAIIPVDGVLTAGSAPVPLSPRRCARRAESGLRRQLRRRRPVRES